MLVFVFGVNITQHFVIKIYISCISLWTWPSHGRLGSHIQHLTWERSGLTHGTDQMVVYGGRQGCLLGSGRGAVPAPVLSLQQHGTAPQAHCCAAVALLCIFFSCPLFPGAGDDGDGFTNGKESIWASCIPIVFPLLVKLSRWEQVYLFVEGSVLMIC